METKVYSLFLAFRFLVISFFRCLNSSLSRSLCCLSSMSLNFFVLVLSINIQALDNSDHQNHTHNGTSSIADQRKSHTCHRYEFGSTSNGKEHLKRIFRTKTNGDQFIKWILDLQGNLHDSKEKAHTHKDQADGKNPAKLLADRTEIKSFFTTGIFSGEPWQSPIPNHPPVPMANRDCTIWYPSF